MCIIRAIGALTALTLPKQKAPPTGFEVEVLSPVAFRTRRARRTSRRRASSRLSRIVACITPRVARTRALPLVESSSNLVGDVYGAVDVLNVIEPVELIDKTLNLLASGKQRRLVSGWNHSKLEP